MSLAAKVARVGKLTSLYTAGDVLSLLIGFAFMRIFTDRLAPEEMDIVSLARKVASPVGIFFQLGLWAALKSWYFRTDKGERPTLVRTMFAGVVFQILAFGIVLAVVGIWCARDFLPKLPAHLTDRHVYQLWLMILACCAFRGVLQMGRGLLMLEERAPITMCLAVLERVSTISLGLVFVIALSWGGFGRQIGATLGLGMTAAVAYALAWQMGRGGRIKPRLFVKAQRTGVTFIPHQVSGVLALALNGWILKYRGETGNLGVYDYAVQFAMLIQLPMSAIGNAIFPTLAKLMGEGSDTARRQHARLNTLIVTGLTCFALGVAVLSPLVMRFVLNSRYHEAINVLPILALAWTFQGLYLVYAQPIFYLGGGLWLSTATVSSAIVSAVMTWLLVPRYGMYGAAWAMTLCFFVRFIVAFIVSHIVMRLHYKRHLPTELAKLGRVLLIGLVLGIGDYGLVRFVEMPFGSLVAVKLAILVAMAVLLRLTGVISGAEIARARELIGAKFGGPKRAAEEQQDE